MILRIYSLVRNGYTDHNSMDIKSDEPFKLCCLNYQSQKICLKKPNATKISAGLATCDYVPHGRQENKATASYGVERRGHNTEGNVAKQADFVYIEGEDSVTM